MYVGLNFVNHIQCEVHIIMVLVKSVSPNFVVNIFCHCDFIIDFLANSYFILQKMSAMSASTIFLPKDIHKSAGK